MWIIWIEIPKQTHTHTQASDTALSLRLPTSTLHRRYISAQRKRTHIECISVQTITRSYQTFEVHSNDNIANIAEKKTTKKKRKPTKVTFTLCAARWTCARQQVLRDQSIARATRSICVDDIECHQTHTHTHIQASICCSYCGAQVFIFRYIATCVVAVPFIYIYIYSDRQVRRVCDARIDRSLPIGENPKLILYAPAERILYMDWQICWPRTQKVNFFRAVINQHNRQHINN